MKLLQSHSLNGDVKNAYSFLKMEINMVNRKVEA